MAFSSLKSLFYVAAIVGTAFTCGTLKASEASAPVYQNVSISALNWSTDYQGALQRAAAENKPIFLFFTGSDWCVWCHKLEDEVLKTSEFANLAGNKFIFVMVDFPKKSPLSGDLKSQNEKLQKEFSIKGFPSVVILNPQGKMIASTGYQSGGPQKYMEHLSDIMSGKGSSN